MDIQSKNRRRRWGIMLAATGLVVALGYLGLTNAGLWAQGLLPTTSSQSATAGTPAAASTVTIQRADLASTAVSAGGNLALADERSVGLAVGGVVDAIAVAVGDAVQAGDLILQLDTTELERTLAQAQLKVDAAKLALADLQTPATAAEIAKAEAALLEARENLAEVKAGPSAEEIAAARSSLAAASSSYNELQAGPSAAELTQLSADLKKAEIALASAQSAYDQIAWQGNAGMTSQASALQAATIDYEAAQAAYTQATAAANNSELQSAVSTIQDAQVKLDELLNSPTAAEIATAEAAVAEAEASLADVQTGATDNAVQSAEVTLAEALITLESAQRDLAAATVTAPVSGHIMTLDATLGVRSAAGAVVATIADPLLLELNIGVAEADIPSVSVGQAAEVEVDALPGQSFAGIVATIAPVSDGTSNAVSYPVTIQLTSEDLTGVRPGMNAVATLTNADTLSADSWLVPTNALRTTDTGTVVMAVRDGQTLPIAVTAGTVQGEWTIVAAPELQDGDAVVGSLTSSSEEESGFGGGMPPDGGMMGGPPQ